MSIDSAWRKLGLWAEKVSPTWWRVARVTWLRRGHSGSSIMAAAIGFYTLICIGPLALLMAWALQLVMGPGSSSYQWLRYTVNRLAGETAGTIMGEIDALITNPNAHVAGIFSALVLIWAGLRLFEALEISLTDIWPGPDQRSLVGRKLIALASMIVAGLLFIVAILLTAFLPAVTDWLTRLPMVKLKGTVFLQPGLRVVVEVLITFLAFFLLFKFIPAQMVATRAATVGGLFTAVVWRAVTPLFTLVVTRSAERSAVYGGLAGIVMFLTWAFFGAQILLLGAHLAAAYEHVVCRERPRSLDRSFIRMRGQGEDAGEEEPDETFYGPRNYPPPGHV